MNGRDELQGTVWRVRIHQPSPIRRFKANGKTYTFEVLPHKDNAPSLPLNDIENVEDELLTSIWHESNMFGDEHEFHIAYLTCFPWQLYDLDQDFGRIDLALDSLVEQGFIECPRDAGAVWTSRYASILPAGKRRALKLLDHRRPKTIRERVAQITRSD
jgi:hypothetical protein